MEGQGEAGGERPVVFLCEALKQSCAGTCQSRVSRRSGSPDSTTSCRSHMKERERERSCNGKFKGITFKGMHLGEGPHYGTTFLSP